MYVHQYCTSIIMIGVDMILNGKGSSMVMVYLGTVFNRLIQIKLELVIFC